MVNGFHLAQMLKKKGAADSKHMDGHEWSWVSNLELNLYMLVT